MHRFPSRNPKKRAFSLIELIVTIVVLGLLATLAFFAFRAHIDRTTEAKQTQRMSSLLREARALYLQNIYTDPTYTWQQAIVSATADLPAYKTNALDDSYPEGVSATGGSNLNTGSNSWTLEADTGSAVYSSVSSEIVFKVQSNTLYVSSYVSATRGVFGMVSQTSAPSVWVATCGGSTCDAESATSGPPSGGAYAVGTTLPAGPTVSYATGVFSLSGSSQVLSATTTGSPTSFSYTGTLPSGVTFDTSTGAFTGPSAWNATPSVVSAGVDYTCAVTSTGAARCWGANSDGNLGDGTTSTRKSPTTVSGLSSGVSHISAATFHTCAALTNGEARCWGSNSQGQLGDNSTNSATSPVTVLNSAGSAALTGVSKVYAGRLHSCALLTNTGVKCWGLNNSGQLGNGTSTNSSLPVDVLVAPSGAALTGVTSLSVGDDHTCAVLSNADLKCWGANGYGQLGDGTTSTRTSPVSVSGMTSLAASVSAAGYGTCAVTTTGAARCWGWNAYGQLGNNTTTNSSTPSSVVGLSSSVAVISAGSYHTCAVLTSGAVKCWGTNSDGQLGNGTTTDSLTSVSVSGLTTSATTVSVGRQHTCAILADNTVQCWGWNGSGQLGVTSPVMRTTPGPSSGFGSNSGVPAAITVTATGPSGSASTSVTLSVA